MIGVPTPATALAGLDALLSIVQTCMTLLPGFLCFLSFFFLRGTEMRCRAVLMLDGSPPGLAAPLSASTFTHTLLTGRLALLLVLAAALHSSPGVAEEPPAQAMAAFLLHLSGGPMRVGMSEDGGPTTWRNRGWRGAIAVEVQRLDGDTVRVTVTLGEAGGKRVIKAGDIRRGESVVISPPVDIEADYFGAGNWPLRIEYLGNWT